MAEYKTVMEEFDLKSIPELDTAVLAALELFAETTLPPLPTFPFSHPLIVGSGNAAVVGEMLFGRQNALMATAANAAAKLESIDAIDGLIIVSASGGKDSVGIARTAEEQGIPVALLTNNPDAPAARYARKELVTSFPKNREPYTYNVSTYLGMLLAGGGEEADVLRQHLVAAVEPLLKNDVVGHDAFFITLPDAFAPVARMIETKFDELFGARVHARVYSESESKHAKTLVETPGEIFVGIGTQSPGCTLPLPTNVGPAAVMCVGYYLVGAIQRAHPPYFKERLATYAQEASDAFGEDIQPIVE